MPRLIVWICAERRSHGSAKLGRRISEEQRLADLLAPTQQLVRPLLVIVAADTPVAGKDA